MNCHVARLKRFIVVVLALAGTASVRSALVHQYDLSGNLTNCVSTTNSSLITSISSSSQSILVSNQLSLSVVAGGSGPVTYQWRLNGANITGATDSTYFIPSASTADAGTYSVVVTGITGSSTVQAGDITVLAAPATLYGIAYGLGKYVAVGENGTIVVSSDLVAWAKVTSPTNTTLQGIAFGTNTFVAVGTNATILTSTDGTNWTIRIAGNTNSLKDVTYAASLFVAVGSGGTVLTSPDGITWTTRTFDYPELEAVTFGTNLFVAVGTGGTIWTSTNAINWSNRSWTTNLTLKSVAFGNEKFFAIGEQGLILTSANGVSWSQQFSGAIQTFESALFYGGTFCALGPIGKNYMSASGAAWDDSDAGTFDQLYGSTVGNNIAVAVGKNGTVVRIPFGLADHFEWAVITSPQRVNQTFSATVTAKDAVNNTVANFNGTVSISAAATQSQITNQILGSISPTFTLTNSGTIGYSLTPNADLLVTQFRGYEGNLVAVWTDLGELLADVAIPYASGSWGTTTLPAPLVLKKGRSYVVGLYSTNKLYYRVDGSTTFSDGTLNQALVVRTNADFPGSGLLAYWPLVDLTYVVQRSVSNSLSPTSATLASGSATINVSISTAGDSMVLSASDGLGHIGASNPFLVYGTNDLAVVLTASPVPASALNNLTYLATVLNSGPNSSTSVNLTNTLPDNVSFVSATPSQGSCSVSGNKVSCSLGTVASQGTASVSIVVSPLTAGIFLTDSVQVIRAEAESNATNNTAILSTYIPPLLYILNNITNAEGNVGTTTATFTVLLTSPSVLAVSFDGKTLDGTALAGSDYIAVNQRFTILPGFSGINVPVTIQGDTTIEGSEILYFSLANATNATIYSSLASCTITNDDGLAGKLQYLAWNAITSPQRTNQPFQVAITARDASNNVATTFDGTNILRGANFSTATNILITNDVHTSSANLGLFSVGYDFTPTNDIFVTRVRCYSGSKISIWNSGGFLLTSTNVESSPGEWRETELATPLLLKANQRYRIALYSGGDQYYWRTDGAATFADGNINQSYYGAGDAFPTATDSAHWYMVDLAYTRLANIAPVATGNFTNGLWAGSLTVSELSTNFVFMADDGDGHTGFSQRFGVYQQNDLAVTISSSPVNVLVSNNLIYTVQVLNSGPNSATGVSLTNTLPADLTSVTFLATFGNGNCTNVNGIITCNIGTLGSLSSATLTVTGTPTVAGMPLTNLAHVVRAETDADVSNNDAVSVVTPSVGSSVALRGAVDYAGTTWRSGGNEIWLNQTNATHDGIDASRSGPILHNQESWTEATFRGPGTLTFWWKVSSQTNADILTFLARLITNNTFTTQTSISGEVDWQQKSYFIPSGQWVLRWKYAKDSSISVGSDAGWLDQVAYAVPAFSFSSPYWSTNRFYVTMNSTNGQALSLEFSSDLIRWLTFFNYTNSSSSTLITITPGAGTSRQFYRASHRNE